LASTVVCVRSEAREMVAFAMAPKRIYTDDERRQRANAASKRWKQNNRERFNKANAERRRNRRKPCPVCNNLMKETARVCSGCFKGEHTGKWKGGSMLTVYGYRMVKAREGEAGQTKNGYILEHRRVVQDHIGRALFKYENVHHKNGVRDDNRLENLELWVKPQPPGQRPEDLVEWALKILNDYAPEKMCR